MHSAAATAAPAAADPPRPAGRTPEQAERLVLELIAAHADSLLRVARRYSMCADDANDAYQRSLEILMRHAGRLEADRAPGWLHTVVKREAMAVSRARRRDVAGHELDLEAHELRTTPSPEEQALGADRVARAAEALGRLKPQELRALWLKALGNSYVEIGEQTGWSYTKVNRCITEGRRSFLERFAGIEAGEECRRWEPLLSALVDGEASAEELAQVRPHLRNCPACRAVVRELHSSSAPLAAVLPAGGLVLDGGRLDGLLQALLRGWDAALWRLTEWGLVAGRTVEAASAPKVAAVAATAAIAAGGGLAARDAERPPSRPTAATVATRPVVRASTPASAPARRTTVATAPARRSTTRRRRARRATPAPVRRAPAATTPEPAPVAPRAPAPTTTTTARPPAPVPRAPAANDEFSFETP